MSYKAFKEYFQSCPVRRCSAADAPLSSHHRFSSSSAAADGEERKPPKTSLKDKIAALDLLGAGSVRDVRKVVPSSFPSPISTQSPIKQFGDEVGFGGKKRSFLESSNEIEVNNEGSEENGDGLDEWRNKNAGAHSSSHFVPLNKKKSKPVATLSSSLRSNDDFQWTNSFSAFPVCSEKGGEDEEGLQIVNLGDEEEVGCDSEAGLFTQPEPEGPFEPLVLWSPAGEGSSNGVAEERIIQVPASINSRLFDHQREGVLFFYDLYRKKEGGVLGDDMGLGKTIQTIAFLAAILRKDFEGDNSLISTASAKVTVLKQRCEKVVLIICPTSVVQNWEQEFHAWGAFEVGICHGLQREIVLARVAAKELEIVLTSHDTFRIHGDELCKIHWDCVVVDEAHRLKNDKSQFYVMCSKLPTSRRYGLTGTVMQNKYMELFNVFDWATPGCLGTRDHFREYYSGPIAEGQRISAPQRFVTIAEDRKKHLSIVLRSYHLRRTKQETIGHLMKGKVDNVVFCPMSSLQKSVYKRVLQSPDYQALRMKGLPCSCGSPLTRAECCFRIVPDGVIWPYLHKDSLESGCDFCPYCLLLPCLTKLRLLSNHLELIKPNPKDDLEKQDKDYKFAEMAFGEDVDVVGGIQPEQSFMGLSDAQHCGKMSVLEKLLASWITQGDKVLLFSDSVRMLDILEKLLIRKSYCYSRLDGSIPMNSRQALVEDFNHSPSKQIFIISTRAGGLGLNLTSANRVVIFDPNWNPAHDLQAQDRSFRFGQLRHVTVFRLLAAGTLEELVYTRQIYKQQLFNIAMSGASEKRYFEGVQGSKQHKGELFGMTNLFRDISEDLFAEDIIENHEERLVRIQRMAAVEDKPGEKPQFPFAAEEDEIDYHGYITCEETEHLGCPQLASEGHDQDQGHTEEELRTQRMVQKALTKAGVTYLHRNEDVVNLAPAVPKAPRRFVEHKSNVQNRSRNQEKKVNGKQSRLKKERMPQLAQNIAEAEDTRALKDTKSSSRDPIRAKNGRLGECARPEKEKDSSITIPIQTKNQGLGEGKKAAFAQLAKSKGMGVSEFSKWFLSATVEERSQLRTQLPLVVKSSS